jgi:hypothetical protein
VPTSPVQVARFARAPTNSATHGELASTTARNILAPAEIRHRTWEVMPERCGTAWFLLIFSLHPCRTLTVSTEFVAKTVVYRRWNS